MYVFLLKYFSADDEQKKVCLNCQKKLDVFQFHEKGKKKLSNNCTDDQTEKVDDRGATAL